MYEAVVYFAGPKTVWGGTVQDEDILMREPSRWRWLAKSIARSLHARLDPSRCGWLVLRDGVPIDHVEPVLPKPPQPPSLAEQVGSPLVTSNARLKAQIYDELRRGRVL